MTVEIKNKILAIADTAIDDTGVIYPRDIFLSLCEDKEKEYTGSFTNVDCSNDPHKVAIVSKNLKMDGNILLCDFTILDTHYGILLQNYIKSNQFKLALSGEGMVSLAYMVSDYTLKNINVELT